MPPSFRPSWAARPPTHSPEDDRPRTSTSKAKQTPRLKVDPSFRAGPSSRKSASPLTASSDDRFYVLCTHDYDPDDHDHLSFKKNDVLEVIKIEPTGWWGACRVDDEQIGWIPSTFVQRVSDDTALYFMGADAGNCSRAPDAITTWPSMPSARPVRPLNGNSSRNGAAQEASPSSSEERSMFRKPFNPSPSTPVPKPPPPSSVPRDDDDEHDRRWQRMHDQRASFTRYSASSTSGSVFQQTSPDTEYRSSVEHRHEKTYAVDDDDDDDDDGDDDAQEGTLRDELESDKDELGDSLLSPGTVRGGQASKVLMLTGDGDAQAFHIARATAASLPWYLQPVHTGNNIKLDYDGSVMAGTLEALAERLTVDPLRTNQDTKFRQVFLSTMKTFSTADEVFKLLTEMFHADPPDELSDAELEEWRLKKLQPVRRRILNVLKHWVQDNRLISDDPQLVPPLKEFLHSLTEPPLILDARELVESLSRTMSPRPSKSISSSTPKRRKSSKQRSDLSKLDAQAIAYQLTLNEHELYRRIHPSELLAWCKTQKGEKVANLLTYMSTHERLSSWVRWSILSNESLTRRADIIDLWIRVAEKCRALNNLSSTSALVAALTSGVVKRLHLTWAHVNRSSHLEPLEKLNDPSGSFAAFRSACASAEGACVPFITMNLTDMIHVSDQQRDTVGSPEEPLINFVKRLKWYDSMHTILRHQSKSYPQIVDDESLRSFIEKEMDAAQGKDIWERSQTVQNTEIAHADIRRALEAAGFGSRSM